MAACYAASVAVKGVMPVCEQDTGGAITRREVPIVCGTLGR